MMSDPSTITGIIIGGSSIATILGIIRLADFALSKNFIRKGEFKDYEKNTQVAREKITDKIVALDTRVNGVSDEVHKIGVHVEWIVKAIEQQQPQKN